MNISVQLQSYDSLDVIYALKVEASHALPLALEHSLGSFPILRGQNNDSAAIQG